MSVVKELKNTPQKIAEKKEENKRIKIKDVVFFDKGGVDIFQQWVVKRLEWSVTLSRAPVHRSERWWSQTLDHRLIGLMAVASRYNILPEQYCQNEKDKNYVSMKTVHNLCTASHTTLQKIVSDGVARGDLLPLVTKNGDKRQSIFTASEELVQNFELSAISRA